MDKRIARTLDRAREAALEVLARGGLSAFTMEAVAAHSGIAKSTLYRHWPDCIALLTDALHNLNRQPGHAEPLKPRQLRARVLELLTHLATVLADSRIAAVLPALVEAAQHHPRIADFLHTYSATRRQTLVELLQSGVKLGELPAGFDPQLASLMLSGPFFYCRLMSPRPLPVEDVERLVDMILGAKATSNLDRSRSC